MKKFTIPAFKKELAKKTKADLIQEISTLCQKFPGVREYYKAQSEDVGDIVKKYNEIIEKEFVEGKTRGWPKARLPVAKKAVKDFKGLIDDPELVADVMFTFVESISDFNKEFSVDEEEFYVAPENMFEEALKLLKKEKLLDRFEERAYEIVENATDGFGHQDTLREYYEDFYGEFPR